MATAVESKKVGARDIMKVNSRVDIRARKIVKVNAEKSPSSETSIRTAYLWPHLKPGITVQEWHGATKAHGGVPIVYVVELAMRGDIEFDTPLVMPK